MKKSFLMLLAGGILALYSCSDKNATADEAATETTEQVVPTEGTVITTPAETGVLSPDGAMPDAGATAAAPAAAVTSASGPLNPAHGEPGHRCEIAVGAPLSSAPTAAPGASAPTVLPSAGQAPTTQRIEMPSSGPAPTSVMSAPAPAPAPAAATAPGMNPPHGQPGHDCAIAVGAPLKK